MNLRRLRRMVDEALQACLGNDESCGDECGCEVYDPADDPSLGQCRIESAARIEIHADPNSCQCASCLHGLEVLRRLVAAEADRRDAEAIFALPAVTE